MFDHMNMYILLPTWCAYLLIIFFLSAGAILHWFWEGPKNKRESEKMKLLEREKGWKTR